MTIKLTAASFLAGVKQSGLIAPERIDSLLRELLDSGVDGNDSVAIAMALVDRQVLTEWQSEKLLQGRHKGFLLGRYVPGVADYIEVVILVVIFISILPGLISWWRARKAPTVGIPGDTH